MGIKRIITQLKRTMNEQQQEELRKVLPSMVIKYPFKDKDGRLLTREEEEAFIDSERKRISTLYEEAGCPIKEGCGFLVVPMRGQLTEQELSESANMLEPRE